MITKGSCRPAYPSIQTIKPNRAINRHPIIRPKSPQRSDSIASSICRRSPDIPRQTNRLHPNRTIQRHPKKRLRRIQTPNKPSTSTTKTRLHKREIDLINLQINPTITEFQTNKTPFNRIIRHKIRRLRNILRSAVSSPICPLRTPQRAIKTSQQSYCTAQSRNRMRSTTSPKNNSSLRLRPSPPNRAESTKKSRPSLRK